MNEVLNYLKENPVFFLATEESGQPRVRPFGAVADFEGRLYIITSNLKDVYQQMIKNPKIELCAADQKGGWLRVTANACRDESRAAREKMLADNPSLNALYSVDDGKIEVLYLKDAVATFSSFTVEPKTIRF